MTAFADTHAIAAPRPWLSSFFDFLFRDPEAALRDQLLAQGVTIMSTRQVEEHVMKVNRTNRPTIWHSILHIIGYVTAMLSLRLPLHFLLRTESALTGLFALGLAIVGVIATYFGASSIFALPAAAWAFEISIAVFLLMFEGSFKNDPCDFVVKAVNRWHLYRPNAFPRDALPEHIQQRLSTLEDMPGVRPRILADSTDPFLVAVSGYGPFAARCYVGAWRTGDKQLDAFR